MTPKAFLVIVELKYHLFNEILTLKLMKLVIVSNRLPVSVSSNKGKFSLKKSVGGLAVGLESYFHSEKGNFSKEYIWVGWPGELPEDVERKIVELELEKKNLKGVFLSQNEVENFYNGFCNDTIWPLFHYFTSYVSYNNEWWSSYKKVNELYADAVLECVEPGDTVWVHDFHLMLLPQLLKQKMPELKIGFFLHIPFPVFEVFRLLPNKWRQQILYVMLGSDTIGFHTYDYTRYFLDCVQRIVGYENNAGVISVGSRKVKVETFPMGIQYEKFQKEAMSETVKAEKDKLIEATNNLKIILSIDRLDYTKGIIVRLKAYEKFLQNYPEWLGKVVFFLVVVPSRTDVERYMEMKRTIDELVGKINGNFAKINWTPILYQYKSLSPERLSALYSLSDIALVTPLRDGMNLIAKEYIASKTNQTGVLILSEMAGAAQELGEALIVNPNHQEEIYDALSEALTMSIGAQQARIATMQNRIKSYTVNKWAKSFLNTLMEFFAEQEKENGAKILGAYVRGQMKKDFKEARSRLILLDYDGTLVPFSKFPLAASPDEKLVQLLKKLSALPHTRVVLISGRERRIMEKWFDIPGLNLVAEHGIWIKEGKQPWGMIKTFKNAWKEAVIPVLKRYSERLPGSFIEEKEFSIAWHYRLANQESAQLISRELMNNLTHMITNMGVQILQGNKVIELRNSGADKGTVALHFQEENTDFVLAIGDDTTDEDVFLTLEDWHYSVKVGGIPTHAHYIVDSFADVRQLLEHFVT